MSKHKKRKSKTKRTNTAPIIVTPPRNPYANHPLMRKGGVHQKSKKSLRANARRDTKKIVRDWATNLIGHIRLFFF